MTRKLWVAVLLTIASILSAIYIGYTVIVAMTTPLVNLSEVKDLGAPLPSSPTFFAICILILVMAGLIQYYLTTGEDVVETE